MLQQGGLQGRVGAFIDDLANGRGTPEEAAEAAEQLFAALHVVNFRARADKVFLGLDTLPLVGYMVVKGKLTVDSSRVTAIAQLSHPTNRSQLRSQGVSRDNRVLPLIYPQLRNHRPTTHAVAEGGSSLGMG